MTPEEIEDIKTENARLEGEITRAWEALGVDPNEAADDPDTAALSDSIRVSLQHERNERERVIAAYEHDRAARVTEKDASVQTLTARVRELDGLNARRPRLGVVPLVAVDDQLILGKRAQGVHAGKWILPGGGVEFREGWRAAGVREYLQETGMRIEIRDGEHPLYVMEIIGRDTHRVCLVVAAKALDPLSVLRPADGELSEVRGFKLDELPVANLTLPVFTCLDRLGFIRRYGA